MRSLLIAAATAALCSFDAVAQTLPEVLLHFHGNTHEGDPLPCSGNGATDVDLCGGPFLTESGELDAAPAAHFEFNPLIDSVPRSPVDSHWTWTPAAPATTWSSATGSSTTPGTRPRSAPTRRAERCGCPG